MQNTNITSIGEILFDIYPDRKNLGGAPFNFIYHIWKLTGEGNFISRIGEDDNGERIISFLKANGFPYKHIQVDPKAPTGTVEVTLDSKGVPEFIIKEDTAYDRIHINEEVKDLVKHNTGLLYYGTLARRNNNETKKTADTLFGYGTKKFCDLNLRQEFYSEELLRDSLDHCDVLKVNQDELDIILKMFIGNEGAPVEDSARKVMERFGIELVCITMGSEGALLVMPGEQNHYSHHVDAVVDTVGAGDSYAAVLALGYTNRWGLEKTNRIASRFAAEITQIRGAIPENDDIYNKFKGIIANEV